MFGRGGKDEDPLSDDALLKAVRRRILDEVSAKQAASSIINNNLYGGSAHAGGASDTGGVMGLLGGGNGGVTPANGDDPYSYFVDVARKDLPINPETGKPMGWEKSVHRYKKRKDDDEKKSS